MLNLCDINIQLVTKQITSAHFIAIFLLVHFRLAQNKQ